jgi:hypothetical protein
MPDIPTAAQALFPNLPSSAPSADHAPPPDRSAAASIYGPGPNAGIDRARDVMAAGVASPDGAPRSEPGKPAGKDWLTAALSDDGETKEAPERPPAAARAGDLDIAKLGLEPGALADRFTEAASEAGLNQTNAAKMVELHHEASRQYWTEQSDTWAQQSRRQFGSKLDAMVSEVQPLLNDARLTTPEFRNLLGQFGLGNHPAVLDTLARWSAAIRAGRRR